MRRGLIVVVIALAGLVVIDRVRGPKKDVALHEESPIKGAKFASAIPVFPGARLTDMMGGNHYEDIGGPVTFTSQSWFFAVTASATEVVEFYRHRLPQGARQVEAEEGAVAFEWIPADAVPGESVSIVVRTGQLQIGETVTAKGKT